MPTPKSGESKQDFVSRCIPIVLDEGTAKDEKQASAICYNMWKNHAKKDSALVRMEVDKPITAIRSDDGTVRYKCYGVLFGPHHRDLYGTWFDNRTNYHLDWYDKRPWLYNHGLHSAVGPEQVGEWLESGIDEEGIFFIGEMLESFKYQEAIQTMIDQRALYPSSGTLGYLMDWDEDGHVTEWPVEEVSSTVRPAAFTQLPLTQEVVRAYRALEGGNMDKQTFMERLRNFLSIEDVDDEAPVDEQEEQTDDSRAITAAELAEAIGVDSIRTAVEAVDTHVASLTSRLDTIEEVVRGLAQTEIERVQAAISGNNDWTSQLFSVTRSGGPSPTDEELEQAQRSRAPVRQDSGPAGQIMQAQQGR